MTKQDIILKREDAVTVTLNKHDVKLGRILARDPERGEVIVFCGPHDRMICIEEAAVRPLTPPLRPELDKALFDISHIPDVDFR